MNAESVSNRCNWADNDPLNKTYHDLEWGVVVRDDAKLFEMLTLEGAQAGLSWLTILKKREGYREAFSGFDPQRVAGFDDQRIEQLVLNPDIVRHRGKIVATVNNARRILALWESGDTLTDFVWQFVGQSPIQNNPVSMSDVPSSTPESKAMSKGLKKLGFRFVGETTCYAFMQAAGLVNDHLVSCSRHSVCLEMASISG